ncbi:MAG: hypothetical protein R3F08_04225 [Dokdonella sp.]
MVLDPDVRGRMRVRLNGQAEWRFCKDLHALQRGTAVTWAKPKSPARTVMRVVWSSAHDACCKDAMPSPTPAHAAQIAGI